MKKKLSPMMVVGLLVLLFMTFWLHLLSGAASVELPTGTIVGGEIGTDTTWTLAGSPYILDTQNVTVIDNVRLTIEAGVTVELNAGRSMLVNGTLQAVGTPTQPITFTRMGGATQPWGNIQLGGGSVLTDTDASQVSYAMIEGGGSTSGMLYIHNSTPTLDHLTLQNGSSRGLYVGNVSNSSTVSWDTGTVTGNTTEGVFVASGRVALSNLNVANNGGDGIELSSAHDSQLLNSSVQNNGGHGIHSSGSDRLLLQGLTVGGNTGYGIYMQTYGVGSVLRDTSVQGNGVAARLHPDISLENVSWSGNTRSEIEWISGQINSSRTWALLPEINTYKVLGNITSLDNTLLSVEPGVTVQLYQSASINAVGDLWAVGTPTQPITFTEIPGATQPWGQVQIGGGSVVTDSNASQISYATIEGGGSTAGMLYIHNSTPTLDHLTLKNSNTRGLYVGNVSASSINSTVSWDTGTVTGNAGEGVYVASGRVALSNLNVANNGGDGVELNSAHDSQLLNSIVQSNGGNGIRSVSDRLLLEGLTISGNTGYGIYMQSAGEGSVLQDTSVQGNGVAARLHPDVSLDNVSWSGNTRSEIEWISGQMSGSRTWARLPEINTYKVLGNITAPDNTLLSVEPGVTVQLFEYTSIYAYGGLWAVGTPTQPITITEIPGANHPWGMIQIGGGNVRHDSDDSRVSYATFEEGGFGGRLVHIYYSSASMDHVTVRNSSSIGIQVSPWAGTLVTLDTLAVTNNAGYAIRHITPGPSLSYRDLTLQGNGTDAVSIGSGTITTPVQWDLAETGAPVRSGTLHMQGGGFLALVPGTRLEFTANAQVEVWSGSALYALGTPESPITLTGVLSQTGTWKGVWLHPGSRAILRNTIVEYGGASGEPALKMQSPGDAVIVNSSIRQAAGDGVLVDDATPPVLYHNDISGNAFGVRNTRPTPTVDARQVWWGDASGPYHPTLNPGGLGNAVSDGVLFDPWLTSVPTGTVPLGGLIVRTGGPHAASPGQSVIFGATYLNETGQELQDAVLVLLIPSGADFVEAYPASSGEEGIYWPERHHVFWRLGTLPPGASGTVTAEVHFAWGLPAHTDSLMVLMAGSNQGQTGFDLASYLAYVPMEILSTTVLTPAEVSAERQAYPALDAFFVQGLADGFVYASAERHTLTGGKVFLVITLDQPDGSAWMNIMREGQVVQAYVADHSGFTVHTVLGDMIYDRATETTTFTGSLADANAAGRCEPSQSYPTPADCMKNCLEKAARAFAWGYIKALAGFPPMIPPGAPQALLCEYECEEDPTSHYCLEDDNYCDTLSLGGIPRTIVYHNIMKRVCDTDTGKYEPGEKNTGNCAWDPFSPQKCVYGPDGQPRCMECRKERGCDFQTTSVHRSKDPNAKYGPVGDLLPGDVVSYTVTYENVGEGIAYGVYVEDRLSEHFDENTLVIGQGGLYLPTSRTILWEIGELGPHGSPTASGLVTFTAQLRTSLPGGTPIVNQAVVYFPSAPEETPTNPVVNVIWPVVGVPMTVTVQAGHSVNITLAGRDTGQGELTFQVVDPPGRGTLVGTPPALTYTAPAGFAGQDFFTFSASNAITASRPAEVTVLVVPDPADTTPPNVVWTAPRDKAIVAPISAQPVFTDTIGPIYRPYLFMGFDETIDESTVTTTTLLLTKQDGMPIPVTVVYSIMSGEAIVQLRQPLEPATWYTVRATQGIKDLVGNPLGADFEWTFRTTGWAPEIDLVKTVTTDPSFCTGSDTISVVAGTDVTYCYQVTNTGDITMTLHDLDDNALGNIFTGLGYSLSPGTSTVVTRTVHVTDTIVNSATWTAYNTMYDLVASDVATATVNVIPRNPNIAITMTVGTNPSVCASTDTITVRTGTMVYYCVEVTNTGNVSLNLHDLDDDQLGNLLFGLAYDLAPGASVNTVAAGLTIQAVPVVTTVNTATWTAYNAGPSDVATASASATVRVTPTLFLPTIFR